MGRLSERHKRLHRHYFSNTDGVDCLANIIDRSLRKCEDGGGSVGSSSIVSGRAPPRTSNSNRSSSEDTTRRSFHPRSSQQRRTSPSKDALMTSSDIENTPPCGESSPPPDHCSTSSLHSTSPTQVMSSDDDDDDYDYDYECCPIDEQKVQFDDSFIRREDHRKRVTFLGDRPKRVTFGDICDKNFRKVMEGEQQELRTLQLYIDDCQKSAFTRIVASLAEKKTLRQLVIHRGSGGSFSLGSRSAQELEELFEALLYLPKLQSLVLWNFGQGDSKVLAAMLRQQATLLNFQLHLTAGAADEDLLRALASAPALKQVNLVMHKSFPVGEVLKSKTIQAIRVVISQKTLSYAFNDTHLLGLIEALHDHKTLEALDLGPAISSFSFRTLASALWANKKLETLKLSYTTADVQIGSASVLALANLINVNSMLKEVRNHSFADLKVSRRCQVYAIESLEENNALRKFHFFDEHADFREQKEEILRRNKGGKKKKEEDSFFDVKCWKCGNLTDTIFIDELEAMARK